MKPEDYAKAGTEYSQQVALFMWAAWNKQKFPELDLMFAIKNEEKSGSMIVGSRFKAAGVKPSVPDVMLPVARKGYNGFFLEMKKLGKKPRKDQYEKGEELKKQGYYWCWADSWEKAVDYLEWYLG